MFARIENDTVVEWPIASLAPLFPNTSFPTPITESDVPDGYALVHSTLPPQVGNAQMAVSAAPTFTDGKWVQGWDVVDLTEQELADRAASKAQQARADRQIAYEQESDPIFFKWQRGEATQQEWLDKIAEIKARFPAP